MSASSSPRGRASSRIQPPRPGNGNLIPPINMLMTGGWFMTVLNTLYFAMLKMMISIGGFTDLPIKSDGYP